MHKYAPVSDTHTVSTRSVQRVVIRARISEPVSEESLLRDGLLIQSPEIESATITDVVTTTITRVRMPNVA